MRWLKRLLGSENAPERAPEVERDLLKQRFEVLERRVEDLHDSYLKLNAKIAARTRREQEAEVPPHGYAEPGLPGNSERPAQPLSRKEELRKRILAAVIATGGKR
jgi:hypothetical protein